MLPARVSRRRASGGSEGVLVAAPIDSLAVAVHAAATQGASLRLAGLESSVVYRPRAHGEGSAGAAIDARPLRVRLDVNGSLRQPMPSRRATSHQPGFAPPQLPPTRSRPAEEAHGVSPRGRTRLLSLSVLPSFARRNAGAALLSRRAPLPRIGTLRYHPTRAQLSSVGQPETRCKLHLHRKARPRIPSPRCMRTLASRQCAR